MKLLKNRKIFYFLPILTLMTLSALSCSAFIMNDNSTNIKRDVNQTWVPPIPDNIYYSENLEITVLNDGSVIKEWEIVDNGIDNITCPINLPTPVNSTSLALEDLQIRIAAIQNDGLPVNWGSGVFRSTSPEFIDNDNIENTISHVFLEFYAIMNNSANSTIILPIFDNFVSQLESEWEGVTFLKFGQTGVGTNTITQTWRAFPSESDLTSVFEKLITENLPTTHGLFKLDNQPEFLESNHKNIHIAYNWDGTDPDDVDPINPGEFGDDDQRWEYIAGISTMKTGSLNIATNSTNTFSFGDILGYSGSLGSHPHANSSNIGVNFYHGSQIVAVKPKFTGLERVKTRYELDMLSDSGEGANYELPSNANINFTDGTNGAPVLTLKVTSDKYIVEQNENFTLTYEVSNIGDQPVNNVILTDDLPAFPVNFTIMEGGSGLTDISNTWSSIAVGDTVTFPVKIYCNTTAENGSYVQTDPLLEYHPSTYTNENLWDISPRGGMYSGYQVEGNEIFVLCNDTSPIIITDVTVSKTATRIGDTVEVMMNITNVGNDVATDVSWEAPLLGINTSAVDGTISSLNPSETVTVNSSFFVDYPLRLLGDFIEGRYFGGEYEVGSVLYQYLGGTSRQYVNEIPINIYPKSTSLFGPIVVLNKEITDLGIENENYAQVTITARNVGNLPAHYVRIYNAYPIENYTLISGSTTQIWSYLPEGIDFTYSYIISYSDSVSLSNQVSYTTAIFNYIAYSGSADYWFDGYSSESLFDYSKYAPKSSSGEGALVFVFGLGFAISAVAAIGLGYLLLKEKGMVGRY